jgi:predicted DNA-binding protein (MmcQ/YjbR family)
MTPEELAGHALGKPGAWPDTPWENDTVAKVGPAGAGRIFAFLGTEAVGVKCGPGREGPADEWLDRYPDNASVMAYIGRSGWNSLDIGGAIPDDEILAAVDESYALVVSKLPRKHRPDGWDA